jgi:hypothetical protein
VNKLNHTCLKCNKSLSIDNFYEGKNICKECLKEYKIKNRKREWALGTLRNHRKKGNEILINVDQLEELAEETTHCKYCGRKLQWERFKGFTDAVPTLDRINNENIISIDNIDIICHNCNSAKGKLNINEFKSLIIQMYEVTILGSKNEDFA